MIVRRRVMAVRWSCVELLDFIAGGHTGHEDVLRPPTMDDFRVIADHRG